nr:hypothetical protein GCM10020093_111580 [Planobispora longispora]
MAFDERRYVREVLEPARQAGGALSDDLRVRYQLREPMSGAEIAETVAQVRQGWRRLRGRLTFRPLIDRLSADHEGHAPIFAAAAQGDLGPSAPRCGRRTGVRPDGSTTRGGASTTRPGGSACSRPASSPASPGPAA